MNETAGGGITVIDRDGLRRNYDADDFDVKDGHLLVTKDGGIVAAFAPGFIGAYRPDSAG